MQHCKLYSIKVLNCEARSSLLSLSNFAYYITYPQILSPMLCTPWLLNRNQINSRDAPFQVIRYENSGLLNPDSFHYPSSTVPDTAVHKVTSVSHLKWGFVMSELLELFGHYASVCSFFGISVPSVTGDWVTWEECSAPHSHSPLSHTQSLTNCKFEVIFSKYKPGHVIVCSRPFSIFSTHPKRTPKSHTAPKVPADSD